MIQKAIIRGLLVVLALWAGVTLLRQNAVLRADLRAAEAETEQVQAARETDRLSLTHRLRSAEALSKRKETERVVLEKAVQEAPAWGAGLVPPAVRAALGMRDTPAAGPEPTQRAN